MKRSSEGLSLEIKQKGSKYHIVVSDKTSTKAYKEQFEADKDNKEALEEMLENAKEWLWNMGNYNGQANEMLRKYNSEFMVELGI